MSRNKGLGSQHYCKIPRWLDCIIIVLGIIFVMAVLWAGMYCVLKVIYKLGVIVWGYLTGLICL